MGAPGNIAIKINDLSKVYKKPTKDGETTDFYALKDVNLEVKKGEILGIIGKNGSGKSTLLKILSGITKPSSGSIEINGTVNSILDVGTGFHPDLSGRENVYLRGELLGMTSSEIQEYFDEIVNFSGIGDFIDTPVKNYSSGMFLRLAFSVVIYLKADILLLDEVISVGDAVFRNKVKNSLSKLLKELNKTVIMISHNPEDFSFFSSLVYLEKGVMYTKENSKNLIERYFTVDEKATMENPLYIKQNRVWDLDQLYDKLSVSFHNNFGDKQDVFLNSEEIHVTIVLENIKKYYDVGVCIRDKFGTSILEISHILDNKKLIRDEKNQKISFNFEAFYFNNNSYTLDVIFFNQDGVIGYANEMFNFKVKLDNTHTDTLINETWGFVKPYLNWKIEKFSN